MAQVFLNAGLTVMLNQLITNSPTTISGLYVGLFSGLSGTTVPAATATLASGITEVSGNGYARKAVTFASPVTATSSVASATTSSSGNSAGNYYVTLTTTTPTAVAAGMVVTIGGEVKVVTGLQSTNQVVFYPALVSNQNSAAVTFGDYLPPTTDTYPDGQAFPGSGVKTIGGAVTFGAALGTWTAANGYFITTASSGTSGTTFYAANFADASSPTLNANDTFTFTPTWLLSN